MGVDFEFLSRLEGGCRTKGYVPDAGHSQSGVTIATGFDLGARNEGDLRRLGFQESFLERFRPYLGLRRLDAVKALNETPLTISQAECLKIDRAVKSLYLAELARKYDNAISSTAIKFHDLKPEFQTVITSVSFQYGLELARVTPRFWIAVTSQDWRLAVSILRDFKDRYPTRRNLEADLMEQAP